MQPALQKILVVGGNGFIGAFGRCHAVLTNMTGHRFRSLQSCVIPRDGSDEHKVGFE